MADLQLRTTAHVVEIGEIGEGPGVTLEIDGGEVLLALPSMEACRSLAPLLATDVEVTITIPVPETLRG
jgi:hypothetical protein